MFGLTEDRASRVRARSSITAEEAFSITSHSDAFHASLSLHLIINTCMQERQPEAMVLTGYVAYLNLSEVSLEQDAAVRKRLVNAYATLQLPQGQARLGFTKLWWG